MSEEGRLPTGLWVEAHMRRLDLACKPYYVVRKGDYSTGLVLLKIDDLAGRCRLLIQQRNFMTDALEWGAALTQEEVETAQADAYIQRSVARDPDLWVIEVEDREKLNPFEE